MEQEINLFAIFRVFLKRWKLIVILPIIAALASAAINLYVIIPLYSSSTTLMIMRPTETAQIAYQDILASRQLVGTYREIAHSRRVLELSIADNSLPYTVEVLRGKINVNIIQNTEVITITAVDPDPKMARDIANGVTRAFIDQVIEIMQVENVSVVDLAVEAAAPFSPRVNYNIVLSFIVGVMISIGLVFLLEYLDRSIKEPEQVKKILDLPVLGVIPRMEEK